jgi:hypothetical protein
MISLFQIEVLEPPVIVVGDQFFLLTVISAVLLILGIIIWGLSRNKVVVGAVYAWIILFAILTVANGLLYYIGYSIELTSGDFYIALTVVGILLLFELGAMIYLGVDPLILGIDLMALVFLGISIAIFYYAFASRYVLSFFFLSILLAITSLDIWGAIWLRNRTIKEGVEKAKVGARRARKQASDMLTDSDRVDRELGRIESETKKTSSGLEKPRRG